MVLTGDVPGHGMTDGIVPGDGNTGAKSAFNIELFPTLAAGHVRCNYRRLTVPVDSGRYAPANKDSQDIVAVLFIG
jgi:hypothetical protein